MNGFPMTWCDFMYGPQVPARFDKNDGPDEPRTTKQWERQQREAAAELIQERIDQLEHDLRLAREELEAVNGDH